MSMIFFVDESGQDRRQPDAYEVLGGIAIPQRQLWPFICDIRSTLKAHFGIRMLGPQDEVKATSLLTNKRLKQAFGPEIPIEQRRENVQAFFAMNAWNNEHNHNPDNLQHPRKYHFESLSQSSRFFCRDVLQICKKYNGRVLAVIIAPETSRLVENQLRADYAALFMQLYECSSTHDEQRSIVVHDERDDSQCRRLADQLYTYYANEGHVVVDRVIPEPMFVKSHLTLGVLVADLIAYVLSWGFRHSDELANPRRLNLQEFAQLICEINHIPDDMPQTLSPFGIIYIRDLTDLAAWTKNGQPEQRSASHKKEQSAGASAPVDRTHMLAEHNAPVNELPAER